jgi:signal transduction histidine kinase
MAQRASVLEIVYSVARRLHVGFFWQLISAFALIILLAGGGILLAGRKALLSTSDNFPFMVRPWPDRLAAYYEREGSWDGVDAMIAGYPCGEGWGPWDDDWREGKYFLATPDGTIVAASNPDRLGEPLRYPELIVAVPIVANGQPVGLLHLRPLGSLGQYLHEELGAVLQRFLVAGLAIGGFALVVGLGLSRVMSHPLVELTTATRAVAAGDMSVRVPTHYPGEMGELAGAFNQMTEDLAQADNLRRNLTTDVAHELRTPLSVIRGKLEGVLDGVYPATPEHLQPILEETKLLTHLVEDLRLLALAETGQLGLERRPMDVRHLLQDAYVNFSPQASDRGVTLALDLPVELPAVMADWRRIAQVLGNLLTNALRHTPQGGGVTLSATLKEPSLEMAGRRRILPHEGGGGVGGRMVEVAVSDTGMGISHEDLPFIFERFWRGEKSRSRAGGGSGLGLAIARQLVQMHGGTIGVESAPGRGSTFRFTLPVV